MEIILTPWQKEAWDAFFNEPEIRWLCWVGGRGSSKTHLITLCLLTLFFDEKYAGSKILIAREALRDLKNTLVSELYRRLKELKIPKEILYTNDQLQVIRNEQTQTEIYYLSLSEKNEQYRSVLSYEFNVVFIDEADRISHEAFNTVDERFRYPHHFQKGVVSLNPTPTNHWIYKIFVEKPLPASKVMHSSTYDNYLVVKVNKDVIKKAQPYIFENRTFYVYNNIRFEVIEELETHYVVKKYNLPHSFYVSMENKPYSYRRIMMEGAWGSYSLQGGIFEKEFTHENIYYDEIPLAELKYDYEVYAGLDFGARHPAYVLVVKDLWDRLIVIDELLGTNISSVDFIDAVKKRVKKKFDLYLEDVVVFGDIAGRQREQATGQSIFNHIWDRHRIRVIGYYQKVEEGIYLIKEKLKNRIRDKPELRIAQSCELCLAGFLGEWRYDERGKVVKDNFYEHIFDALRYCIYGIEKYSSRRRRVKINKPSVISANLY